MKFNHLNVPDHWKHYWTRFPEGYTILEALISWVSQVDSMVDHQNKLNDNVEQFRNEIDVFVERFDERLQDEVTLTLKDWQDSGFLEVVISEALQWQLTDYIATNEADKLSINEKLQETDLEVANNKKALLYVTPEMFGYDHANPSDDIIQEWLDYARTNNILAKAQHLEINRDFNFRNVALEITGNLNIKTHEIELGGNPNTWQQKTQKINNINQTYQTKSDLQVVIRGSSNQRIEIGRANGVKFRMNDDDDKIAYSTFVFGVVYYIDIDNDDFNVSGDKLLWFNENELHLSITYHLRMNGTYWHNNNRFYGGTFEGLIEKIEILKGRDNAFYNMRFENVSTEPSIFFGDDTYNNTIYQTYTSSHPSRRVLSNGKGYGNKIIIPTYDYSTKIIDELATSKTFDVFTKHGSYLKVDTVNEHLLSLSTSSPLFHTSLLPYKPSYAVHVSVGNKLSGGVRMQYRLFDSNFNEILDTTALGKMDGFGDLAPNTIAPNSNALGSFYFNMTGITPHDVKYVQFLIQSGTQGLSCSNVRVIVRDLNSSI